MRLYIIRHADPDYKNKTITEYGHKEARALAKRLKHEGIDEIYCSPIQRAVDTMNYTKDLINIDVKVIDWVKEIGDWMEDKKDKYKSAWDVPAEILLNQERYPDHENWFKLKEYKGLNLDKKFKLIQKNSDAFLEKLGYKKKGRLYECVNPNQKKIAVFCHAGFKKAWLAHLLQVTITYIWAGFWVAPSSVTTIVFEKRSDKYAMPKCINFGDVSHLYKEDLSVRPRGFIGDFY